MKKRSLPLFPYREVFPVVLADLIAELEAKLGFPVDYTSVCFLVAFGAAVGNTVHLRFKNSFIENTSLFMMIIGKPSVGKTAPIKYCLKYLLKRNQELYSQYQRDLKAYEQYLDLKKAKEAVDFMEEPVLKICVLQDYTLEAMLSTMRNNPRGICVYSDELAGLIQNTNRYSNGSDLEVYLSAWSHTPLSVTRKGTGHFQIPNPFISILGGIQPGVLNLFFNGKNNGFVERWDMVSVLDDFIPEWTDEEIDSDKEVLLERAFSKLFELPEVLDFDGNIVPAEIRFTPEARRMMIDWRNGERHRLKLMEEQDESYAAAHMKLDIKALRYALILQIIYYAYGESDKDAVGERAVTAAIKLTDFFKNQIKIAHQLAVDKDNRLLLSDKLRDVYSALPNKLFKTSDAVAVAALHDVSEWKMKRFLKKPEFFEKKEYAMWQKTLIEE